MAVRLKAAEGADKRSHQGEETYGRFEGGEEGGAGGQQSGRGFHIDPPSDGPNHGPISTEGGWKIENAIELLDQEEEYFFDEASRTLYLRPNTCLLYTSDAADE